MNVTPEIVRAEMDYRVERARAGAARERVYRTRPGWVRRLRAAYRHHPGDVRRTAVNGAPRAA